MKHWLHSGLGFVLALALPAAWTVGCIVGKEQVCAIDGDCLTGNTCTAGQCVARPCASDEACGASTECETHRCTAGKCATTYTPAGPLPDAQQKVGDCAQRVCDGHGKMDTTVDLNDLPGRSTAPCTEVTCTAAGPKEGPAQQGAACALTSTDMGVCSTASACVECVADSGCLVGTQARCLGNQCVSCSNGVQDGDETGLDCGGACTLQCILGACTADADCKSGACAGGLCRWANGEGCTSNAQCQSLHCVGAAGAEICQACGPSSQCASGQCVAGACSTP
jgi:hypothetical protein